MVKKAPIDRSCWVETWSWGILGAWFEEHTWLSLVGPELEVKTDIEKLGVAEHV